MTFGSATSTTFLCPSSTPTRCTWLITYKFLKNGRYLVICMNRVHLLNDWMFGFVNVGGGNDDR